MMGHRFLVWLSQKILPGWHEHLVSRTRFIDELVEESSINETEQYVILGAGYDTRAHRLDFPHPLRVRSGSTRSSGKKAQKAAKRVTK